MRRALQTLQLYVAEQLPIMTASQTDLVIGQFPFLSMPNPLHVLHLISFPKINPSQQRVFQKTLPCQARGQRAHFVARKVRLNTCPDRCRVMRSDKRVSPRPSGFPLTSASVLSPTLPPPPQCQPRPTRTTLRQPAVSPSIPAQFFHCFYYQADQHGAH